MLKVSNGITYEPLGGFLLLRRRMMQIAMTVATTIMTMMMTIAMIAIELPAAAEAHTINAINLLYIYYRCYHSCNSPGARSKNITLWRNLAHL